MVENAFSYPDKAVKWTLFAEYLHEPLGLAWKDGWLYVEACQLLDNPKIALRLKNLREQAERLSIFNLSAAMDEFEQARKLALSVENPAAMVAATTGKVKLFGLDKPARVEHAGKDGGPIQTQDMTAADVIAARLAAIKSRASGEPDA